MDQLLGGLIISLGFWSAFAYVPLQIYAGLKWRGAWRIAALVPLMLMIPVFAATIQAFAQESNLWPIVLIFAAPVGAGYLVILFAIRGFMNRRANVAEGSERGEANVPNPQDLLPEIAGMERLKANVFDRWQSAEDLEALAARDYPLTTADLERIGPQRQPPQAWYEEQWDPT